MNSEQRYLGYPNQAEGRKAGKIWKSLEPPIRQSGCNRSHLGSFGIGGELGMQSMYTLSGGQKSRVAFAKVLQPFPAPALTLHSYYGSDGLNAANSPLIDRADMQDSPA